MRELILDFMLYAISALAFLIAIFWICLAWKMKSYFDYLMLNIIMMVFIIFMDIGVLWMWN